MIPSRRNNLAVAGLIPLILVKSSGVVDATVRIVWMPEDFDSVEAFELLASEVDFAVVPASVASDTSAFSDCQRVKPVQSPPIAKRACCDHWLGLINLNLDPPRVKISCSRSVPASLRPRKVVIPSRRNNLAVAGPIPRIFVKSSRVDEVDLVEAREVVVGVDLAVVPRESAANRLDEDRAAFSCSSFFQSPRRAIEARLAQLLKSEELYRLLSFEIENKRLRSFSLAFSISLYRR